MDGKTYMKYAEQVAAYSKEGNTRAIEELCDRLLAECEDISHFSTLRVYKGASVLRNSRQRIKELES